MRKMVFALFCLAAVACMVCGTVLSASAAKYPSKQIMVTQGHKPGGGSDGMYQLTRPYLEKYLGTTIVSQYNPGATGSINWTKFARTVKPDGYTLCVSLTPMIQTNYIMNPELNYRLSDFVPLVNVITDPAVVIVNANSPWNTMQDLMDAIKARPGEITVGNSGTGGDDYFATLRFEDLTGLRVQKIPFEGDGPSYQAVMGNKIDVSMNNLGITYQQIKAGNLKVLCVFSEERISHIPDVPTGKELGIDMVTGASRGYAAPKGLPGDIKQTLIEAFRKMAADPQFIKDCEDRIMPINMLYEADYEKLLTDDEVLYTRIWGELKAQEGLAK